MSSRTLELGAQPVPQREAQAEPEALLALPGGHPHPEEQE